jgi:hypothetical protein
MKTINSFGIFLFLCVPCLSISQTLVDDTLFISSNKQEIKIGDNLIIGYPSNNDGTFIHVSNDTKKKLSILSKIAETTANIGSSFVGLGVSSSSVDVIRTGSKVSQVAGATSNVAGAGEIFLKGENELTGQRVKVLKFSTSGNEKRGIHYYAVVAGSGNSNFKIEIETAIFSKELAGNNNVLFPNFDINSNN